MNAFSRIALLYAIVTIFSASSVIAHAQTLTTTTFEWTYLFGDFENGTGEFTQISLPWVGLSLTDLLFTFELNSIEITLNGSVALGRMLRANAQGSASLSTRLPAAACGRTMLQLLDLPSCATSSVLAL